MSENLGSLRYQHHKTDSLSQETTEPGENEHSNYSQFSLELIPFVTSDKKGIFHAKIYRAVSCSDLF